jgi:hypothetical protein
VQISIDQIIRDTAEATAEATTKRVVAAVKGFIEEREGDRYLTFDECASLTSKPSADAFRMWLGRPDQVDLKKLFKRVGKRPAILRSTFLAYLGGAR